jgi:hypothetical protein
MKNAIETYNCCEVYEDILSMAYDFEWNKRFLEERNEVEDDKCAGCRVTAKTNKNTEIAIIIRMLAETLNMGMERARQIITENLKGEKSVKRWC